MIEVDLGRRLDMASLGKLVTSLMRDDTQPVFIDISQLAWVEPCGIATLLAYIKFLQGAGIYVSVSENVFDGDVERYLQRISFYKILQIEKDEGFHRRDSSGRFIETEIVDSTASTDKISNSIAQIFLREPELKNYMSYMIREIIANAVEHSGCLFGAVVCAQYWPQTNKAQFCVSDCGIGFKRHLSSQYNLKTDMEAIALALRKGVTGVIPGIYGNSFSNVGYGLYITKGLVAKSGGTLKIISGEGLFSVENGYERNEGSLTRPWPGVVVSVELVNNNIKHCLKDCMSDILKESEDKLVNIAFK
ncbi:MAG TPA: ATP-binding protein [Spirochaetia bacterium]|nr:ATP-binding protein [Spirochaetia bacterium]